MKKTFGDYFVIIISIIGSCASTFGFGLFFLPKLNNQGWVGVLFLGTLSFFFLGYCIYLISKYRKRIRYSEIFKDLNIGFAQLHKIDRQDSVEAKEIILRLIELCNSISDSFSRINGHKVSVCIKFLMFKNKRPYAQTLVRDKSSSTERKSGSKDKSTHWISENSDFKFIYSNFEDDNIDTSYYYKTKLPIREGYNNTRLHNWPPQKTFLNKYNRIKQWPLKYRSTLVVPIIPIEANEQDQEAIRGFLCIDSPKNIAFNSQYDVDILKGIADGLYNKIDILHKLTLKEDEQKKAIERIIKENR